MNKTSVIADENNFRFCDQFQIQPAAYNLFKGRWWFQCVGYDYTAYNMELDVQEGLFNSIAYSLTCFVYM